MFSVQAGSGHASRLDPRCSTTVRTLQFSRFLEQSNRVIQTFRVSSHPLPVSLNSRRKEAKADSIQIKFTMPRISRHVQGRRALLRREYLSPIPEDESISFDSPEVSTRVETWQSKSKAIRSSLMGYETQNRNESLDLVNKERIRLGVEPLRRSALLDGLASLHAAHMAAQSRLRHSVGSVEELQNMLASEQVASNVQRGASALEMHLKTMADYPANKQNILSGSFNEYGVGFVLGKDGYLYCCQYFRDA